jgi:phosphinothricin acetyltransferase
MPSQFEIRPAREMDAPAILAIYRPFVEATAVSFETVVPTLAEVSRRIDKALSDWAWLIAEHDGQCMGYAYGSSHRDRAAYRWSVEVSAYIHPNYLRRGIGTALYAELLPQLAGKGYCHAYAGITLPNEGSVALHRRAGFADVGVFKAVGRKFESWHDAAWFQKTLRASPPSD